MGIIWILAFVYAIIGLIRLPKIRRSVPMDYPELTTSSFERWKAYKFKSMMFNIWAGLGVLVINVILLIIIALTVTNSPDFDSRGALTLITNTLGTIVMFILFIIGAVYDGKARSIIKKETHN